MYLVLTYKNLMWQNIIRACEYIVFSPLFCPFLLDSYSLSPPT